MMKLSMYGPYHGKDMPDAENGVAKMSKGKDKRF
jgi:hypothetical protein